MWDKTIHNTNPFWRVGVDFLYTIDTHLLRDDDKTIENKLCLYHYSDKENIVLNAVAEIFIRAQSICLSISHIKN